MKTLELKTLLKLKIDAIQDITFLNALIEIKTVNIILLSDEQKHFINESQKEYLVGNYFENNQVDEEFEKCLSEE